MLKLCVSCGKKQNRIFQVKTTNNSKLISHNCYDPASRALVLTGVEMRQSSGTRQLIGQLASVVLMQSRYMAAATRMLVHRGKAPDSINLPHSVTLSLYRLRKQPPTQFAALWFHLPGGEAEMACQVDIHSSVFPPLFSLSLSLCPPSPPPLPSPHTDTHRWPCSVCASPCRQQRGCRWSCSSAESSPHVWNALKLHQHQTPPRADGGNVCKHTVMHSDEGV